jgi:hypothetical protein
MAETGVKSLNVIFCWLLLCLLLLGLRGCASPIYITGNTAAAFQFEHDRNFEDHCHAAHSLFCKGE